MPEDAYVYVYQYLLDESAGRDVPAKASIPAIGSTDNTVMTDKNSAAIRFLILFIDASPFCH